MFNTKRSKLITITILFIFILFAGNYQSNSILKNKKEYYFNVQNELLSIKYKTSYRYFKIMSQDIYSMYSQNNTLLTLLTSAYNADKIEQNRYRIKIRKLLAVNYKRLTNMGISQVHFHTNDNKSFLRMYEKNEFGDDLTQLRKSVVLANKMLKPQEGFESCRFMVGLRFVYPLFNKNNKHIGSVEISFSSSELLKNITDDFLYDSHILVSKKIAPSSIVESQYLSNYKPSWESNQYYIEELSHNNSNDKNIYKQIATPQLVSDIEKNILTKKVFTLATLYNYQNIILTFFPISGVSGEKNIAYIVKYVASSYISDISIEQDYLKKLFFSITSLLYLFAIYIVLNREKLKFLALYDSLTKLPNRTLFDIEFQNEINRAARHDERLALLFIDLDGFKAINDTYGHQIGDVVLKQVSQVLLSSIRISDIASRLSGDEFTVILASISNEEEALKVAKSIISKINSIVLIEGNKMTIGASIGISLFPHNAKDTQTLIKQADSMMYKAKNNGKNKVFLYNNKEK